MDFLTDYVFSEFRAIKSPFIALSISSYDNVDKLARVEPCELYDGSSVKPKTLLQ